MVDLTRHLPRLSRLRSFEAAARLLSFTEASRELQITQAAVSQQVRTLEQELGVPLFVRLHRNIRLTPQGHRLLRSVSAAFNQIADAAEEVRMSAPVPVLKIGATFAVATFWLIPRLGNFRQLFPHIEVHLVATDRGFQGVADQVDFGIAYGEGLWPGFRSTLLRESIAFPVCSPAYFESRQQLTCADDLVNETLLSIEDDRPGRLDWPAWLSELGVDASRITRNYTVNSHPLLVQAACEGQGIALGWSLLTDDLLASGRLIRPIDAELRTAKGFYFVERPGRPSNETNCFKEWLFDTMAAGAGGHVAARQKAISNDPQSEQESGAETLP